MKKIALYAVATGLVMGLCFTTTSFANDKGPAEMELVSTIDAAKKPKPATFPHAAHQERLACADCHHGKADGKQVPYVEGQKIEKCESCHNKAAGVSNKKVSTFKGAGHALCKTCHKKADKALAKCGVCHPKKKK